MSTEPFSGARGALPAPAFRIPGVLSLSPDMWRSLFALVSIFLATSAFYNFSWTGQPADQPGVVVESNTRSSLFNIVGWLALYGVSGLIVLHNVWRHGLEVRLAALIPFSLYVLASSTWTYNPTSSLVFSVMLVADIVVAGALAAQVSPPVLLAAMARLITVIVAISLVLLVLVPVSVTTTPDRPGLLTSGEFSGVFSHKVHMGVNSASALLILMFQPSTVPSRRWRWLSIAICAMGLLLANSVSAIIALFAAVALILGVRRVPNLRHALFLTVCTIVLAISVLLPHLDLGTAAQWVGRTATLSGRAEFWSLAPDYILSRPWFGYGYGGFFDRDIYSKVWGLWARFEFFFTPNFHNSALDTTILLGFVGLGAYLAILVTGLSVYANRSMGMSAQILAGILILFTASSATDFQFMRHNCLATVLLFYAVLVGGRRYALNRADRGQAR